MSQLLTVTELKSDLVTRLELVAATPFDINAITKVADDHNWHLIPPEEWETGDVVFLRIEIDVDCPPLFAIWGHETLAAIPLAVIYDDDVIVGLTNETIAAFNTRFFDARRFCDAQLGGPSAAGTYRSNHQPFPLSFAFYNREYSTFALLQHDEGDGHLGNIASLEIRIIPHTAGPIELPLKTNLIF